MAPEGEIKGEALRYPAPEALITLRNLLVRCRFEEIEQIPILPTPVQVICMLILNKVRRSQGVYGLINIDDDLPIHPVYARFFLITRRQASLLWRLFTLRRPVPLKRFRNWIEEKELETMLEGGILRIEGDNLRSRYLVTSTSGLFIFTAFLHRTDTGYVYITSESGRSDEEVLEGMNEYSIAEGLNIVTWAVKNPRLVLYQILQYLHRKRQKKKKDREDQLYQRALRQLKEENYERAEYNFNRVLALNSANQMARNHLAALMRELGRKEEAEALERIPACESLKEASGKSATHE